MTPGSWWTSDFSRPFVTFIVAKPQPAAFPASTFAKTLLLSAHMSGWTSPTHIVLILLIALLLFGAKRLPEIGRSLGTGMREFKDSVTGHGPAEPQQLPPAEPTATPTAAASVKERESV